MNPPASIASYTCYYYYGVVARHECDVCVRKHAEVSHIGKNYSVYS